MISQGIGRGNYSNLKPMGKIQMSERKPIKWSTTLFVLLYPIIRSGWGSYFLVMGKVWRSNSNLRSHPFLESVFLTCGESKILGRNSQSMMHPYLSFPHPFSLTWALSHSRKRSELSPSRFGSLPMFSMVGEVIFWNVVCICRGYSRFSVCWGPFLSPS